MAMLTREDILSAGLRHADVSVPEWGEGGVVRVWEMGAPERLAFFDSIEGASTVERIARLVSICMGDATGVFSSPVSPEELFKRPPDALMRVHAAALELNVLSRKAAENVRGNSSGELSGDSRSSSPEPTATST